MRRGDYYAFRRVLKSSLNKKNRMEKHDSFFFSIAGGNYSQTASFHSAEQIFLAPAEL